MLCDDEIDTAITEAMAPYRLYRQQRNETQIQRAEHEHSAEELELPAMHRVSDAEMTRAVREISPLLREALDESQAFMTRYHAAQMPQASSVTEGGIRIASEILPLQRVGLVLPLAASPSLTLGAVIPARVAGVSSVTVVLTGDATVEVAATADGVSDAVLAAAAVAEVSELYVAASPQAVAALTYGTTSVKPVDLVYGCGGSETSQALRAVAGDVRTLGGEFRDGEVLVVVDETTNLEAVRERVQQRRRMAPGAHWAYATWSPPAAQTLHDLSESAGFLDPVILANDARAVVSLVNTLAPGRVEIVTVDPDGVWPSIRNAGAISAGPATVGSVAECFAGSYQMVPSLGSARFAESLNVRDFLRTQSVIHVDEAFAAKVAPYVNALTEASGGVN